MKTTRKFAEDTKRLMKRGYAAAAGAAAALSTQVALAAPVGDTSDITPAVNFIANWAGKFGLLVAFIGGIMFCVAFKGEDANGKTNGIKTVVAGFMVFALTKSFSTLFGL